jgi:uncharacterized HAD superfamily protein
LQRDFERFAEELSKNKIDERVVKSAAKAVAAAEVAKLHNIVMEEFNEFKAKVEEELSKRGVDVEVIRRLVDEVRNSLLGEFDKRVLHLVDVINEVGNVNKDILDLINEVLKTVVEDEEKIEELRNELRSLFDEERIEELLYKALMKHGVIKRRRRKWTPLIAGLGVLAAIVTGLLVNPIATLVILFIIFAILLRW